MAWVAAIVQGVMGGVQMGISMDQLSKLPSAKSFSPATDLETATSMSRRAAQQGMTPQERAVAEQSIGTAQNRTQRAMEQRGLGNLAAAVSQIRTTDAYNQLEAQNQQIKRQSLGQYANLAGQMQSLQNQNISSFNQMLNAQQQALGQSAKAGFGNLTMGMGESIASAVEGKDVVDNAAYTPEQRLQIEAMKAQRPLEKMPTYGELGTNIATDTASPDYQGMFNDASYNQLPVALAQYEAGMMPQFDFNADNYFGDMGFTETGTDFNFSDTTSTGAMAPGGVDSGFTTFD
tara:strand:- start:227 stop:1096 length:870 start_codon:yes stop_codon:yes gene_type:complete